MQNTILNSVKLERPKSSKFDLSHEHKLTCNMGKLIPVFAEECIPGDRWKCRHAALVRFAPMIFPVMHLVEVFFDTYFIPNRLTCPTWENSYTDTDPGGGVPALPYMDITGRNDALSGHLGIGIQTGTAGTRLISPMYHAAYQRCWMDYYRDEKLNAPFAIEVVAGDNTANITNLTGLRGVSWEKDIFTAATPQAQSSSSVNIPIGSLSSNAVVYRNTPGSAPDTNIPTTVGTNPLVVTAQATAGIPNEDLYAQTQGMTITPVSIRDLRRAQALQRFLERENIGGERYNEMVWAKWGVNTGDVRANRPEFIGGSRTPVTFSEVLQTGTSLSSPVGAMSGHGVTTVGGKSCDYFVREHGIIMTMMYIRPRTGYYQGIPRKFLKTDDRYQFFDPLLEHIGDQEIQNKEVYTLHTSPNGTFGYAPRYYEYKTSVNRVSGEFMTSLEAWHMARKFSADPNLNAAFVNCDPTTRVFATLGPLGSSLMVSVINSVMARRMMSRWSTPY